MRQQPSNTLMLQGCECVMLVNLPTFSHFLTRMSLWDILLYNIYSIQFHFMDAKNKLIAENPIVRQYHKNLIDNKSLVSSAIEERQRLSRLVTGYNKQIKELTELIQAHNIDIEWETLSLDTLS